MYKKNTGCTKKFSQIQTLGYFLLGQFYFFLYFLHVFFIKIFFSKINFLNVYLENFKFGTYFMELNLAN